MVTLLCGVVQLTVRVGLPFLTTLDRDTPVTWEGACSSRVCRELPKTNITQFHDVWPWMWNSTPMPQLDIYQILMSSMYYHVTPWCEICIWTGRETVFV